MKKIIALVMALMLIFSCTACFAAGEFTITLNLSDGFTSLLEDDDDTETLQVIQKVLDSIQLYVNTQEGQVDLTLFVGDEPLGISFQEENGMIYCWTNLLGDKAVMKFSPSSMGKVICGLVDAFVSNDLLDSDTGKELKDIVNEIPLGDLLTEIMTMEKTEIVINLPKEGEDFLKYLEKNYPEIYAVLKKNAKEEEIIPFTSETDPVAKQYYVEIPLDDMVALTTKEMKQQGIDDLDDTLDLLEEMFKFGAGLEAAFDKDGAIVALDFGAYVAEKGDDVNPEFVYTRSSDEENVYHNCYIFVREDDAAVYAGVSIIPVEIGFAGAAVIGINENELFGSNFTWRNNAEALTKLSEAGADITDMDPMTEEEIGSFFSSKSSEVMKKLMQLVSALPADVLMALLAS